ncbi:MAG: FAD-binding oxidoreductase [Chitinophagales bacterium]|nr:FAD-binding oxidoreductase [Chitinophagales bacterium]
MNTDMTTTNSESDWWKWGDAYKRKSLTDFPILHQFLKDRWNQPFDHTHPLKSSFSIHTNEERAANVYNILKQQVSHVRIENSLSVRLKKALGKSYPDVLSALSDDPIEVADVVVFPKNHDEILQVLKVCLEHKILIVPFGGGSNVVRAFSLPKNDLPRIVIDMSLNNALLNLDETNHTAIFGGGIYGPAIEKHLNAKGYTLGHFPQSFEYSTLGGWLATRSAGQESSGYGRIDEIVISMRIATPVGEISVGNYEGDAEGINLKSVFLGSEASLGIITEAKVRIHPLPQYKSWLVAVFPSFQHGVDALKQLVQKDIFPTVARFSDELETEYLKLVSSEVGVLADVKSLISNIVLKLKGIEKPTIMMVSFDGTQSEAELNRKLAASIFEKNKGFDIGDGIGKKWEHSRFGLPYLRDDLVERGVFVDTMETVVPWDKVDALRKKVQANLLMSDAFGKEKGVILAHVSHVYTSSASIYFTVITAQQKGSEYQQWEEIKNIVTNTIVSEGGAVSHHHSIGTDHRKWYLEKTDVLTKKVLQNIKSTLDPHHIMNPGKLFDEQ